MYKTFITKKFVDEKNGFDRVINTVKILQDQDLHFNIIESVKDNNINNTTKVIT